MEVPTITKKQAKKALSNKKKKTEVIKNVLAKPYQKYWPLLTPEDNNQLKETLEKLLPRLKNDKINIHYNEISRIPRDERKKFREGFSKHVPVEVSEMDRQGLVFGVNNVSKLLENHEACSVLVASDVLPRLLVQHILDQAVLYNVPVLVVQDLRDIFKSKCGLSAVTIALRQTIKSDSKLGLIQQTISNIYENYPVPKTHINYHRQLGTVTISDSEDEKNEEVNESGDEVTEVKSYLLKREKDKKRAFVPEKSKAGEVESFIELESSFGTTSSVNNAEKMKIEYHSLTVKRVKGNKNRTKRKIEKFKTKKK
jgi:ribosomal protein L7Ae-like RNA K-turn-binding protein